MNQETKVTSPNRQKIQKQYGDINHGDIDYAKVSQVLKLGGIMMMPSWRKLQVITLSRNTTARQDKELPSICFITLCPFPLKPKPPSKSRHERKTRLENHDSSIQKYKTQVYKNTN